MNAILRSFAIAASCVISCVVLAAPNVPPLTGRVVDNANILSNGARQRIHSTSEEHERQTTNQVVVLTVKSLDGASIEEFANRVFTAWKLGSRDDDNGVLVVVAPRERRVRIEVGYGLEATLPDATASRIIRNTITPRFKANDIDGGVERGVRAIVAVLAGTPEQLAATPSLDASRHSSMTLAARVLGFAVFLLVAGLFAAAGMFIRGPVGWIIGILLIPFFSIFRAFLVNNVVGAIFGLGYLILFPIIKIRAPRSGRHWQPSAMSRSGLIPATIPLADTWSSSDSWTSSDSSSSCSSSSNDFSGGGGDSGGGGASGSW